MAEVIMLTKVNKALKEATAKGFRKFVKNFLNALNFGLKSNSGFNSYYERLE
jgi:hypothetical protein